MKKQIIACVTASAMLSGASAFASEMNGTKEIICKPGENFWVGSYPESAAETQKLIDNRPDIQRPMEDMNRGLVAVKTDNGVLVSWRWQGYEGLNVKYNLYRNGERLNSEPLTLTNYTDNNPVDGAKYYVTAVTDGTEGEKSEEVSVWTDGYLEIPLQRPAAVPLKQYEGNPGEYFPGDASIADLDGDGEYEIVLKWDSIVQDAGKGGYTSDCLLDAYELDGTLMWRINMGKNIRSGPHDTQFIAADFDGDGKAEVSCRTADGTIAVTARL